MERDTNNVQLHIMREYFNSHAHVERDENNFKNANKCGNFNSHAHVERDIPRGQERQLYLISTHTLTWSVTVTHVASVAGVRFQLTRSRGA